MVMGGGAVRTVVSGWCWPGTKRPKTTKHRDTFQQNQKNQAVFFSFSSPFAVSVFGVPFSRRYRYLPRYLLSVSFGLQNEKKTDAEANGHQHNQHNSWKIKTNRKKNHSSSDILITLLCSVIKNWIADKIKIELPPQTARNKLKSRNAAKSK